MFNQPAKIEQLTIEPGRRVLVIADVHGNLPYLNGVLSVSGFGGDDLAVFDGDFLEKGEQSLETLRLVMRLCAEGRAKAVCGNCDGWADLFSMSPEHERRTREYLAWRRRGLVWDMCGELGMNPVTDDFSACKAAMRDAFAEEWAFLAQLPHLDQIHEIADFLFDRLQPDQAVELVHQLVKVRLFRLRSFRFCIV